MKMVKQHAVTVNRQRAIELAMSDRLDLAGAKSGFGAEREAATQGLYAQNQTELYIPNPIVDVSAYCLHSISFLAYTDPPPFCRGRYRRTTLVTSICILLQCFQQVLPTFLVRQLMFHLCLRCLTLSSDKGVAKVARQLGFDYAEAVVRLIMKDR